MLFIHLPLTLHGADADAGQRACRDRVREQGAVSSRMAKSSRIRTAGRVNSASRLSQVRSARPLARWARAVAM